MMPIVNRNSYGYFKIYDDAKGETPVICQHDASCSQSVKTTFSSSHIKCGKITFYFPSDYLCKPGQNEEFFKYWISLASDFFHEVKYLGISKSEELGMTFNNIRKGYSGSKGSALDIGNFVFNDSWCVFEMVIKNNSYEIQNRQYCAYCMIRYMFSDHYDQIIKNYNRLSFVNKQLVLKIPEFELFQMSHYYFPGQFGFFQTYVIVHIFSRVNMVLKLLTKENFNNAIKSNSPINQIFHSNGLSGLTVSEFQQKLELNTLKEIYEAIK